MFDIPHSADDAETNSETNDLESNESRVPRLDEAFAGLQPIERLKLLRKEISGKLVFTTSFGLEDQALTHLIASAGIDVHFATLDTGRLFPEVYSVWAETEERYGIAIEAFYPDANSLRELVTRQGINGFYTSIAARKACCAVRKLVPLQSALRGAAAWITGVRADQSNLRRGMIFVGYDGDHAVVKANPLLDWSRTQTARFVAEQRIPSNPLHERGFLSIGCSPCTRAIAPDEPERAGRWWWEVEGTAECGLHVSNDGRLVRAKAPA